MRIPRAVRERIDWLKGLEHPEGGIRGVPGGAVYPEVSGYLIPSLLKWGEGKFAERLGKWLLTQQQPDGGFLGWNLKATHAFDTAMVLDGLRTLGIGSDVQFRAEKYLRRCLAFNGYMRDAVLSGSCSLYNVKASAVIGVEPWFWKDRLASAWPVPGKPRERIHYIAYGLEGAQEFRWDVSNLLAILDDLPRPFTFWYSHEWRPIGQWCTVGNYQMAILLNDEDLFHSLEPDVLAWTTRYFLEAAWYFEGR